MELSKEQSAKLKAVQFEILKKFIEICEKEGLTYWLIAGTAIGAVRHKGFIPWDDDIDVGMPRADYDRFMEIGQKFLPEYYFLQNYKTDPNYPINFAKIRDSRTAYIENGVSHIKMNHGIWMDIFPMDGYPEPGIRRSIFRFLNNVSFARIYLAYDKNVKKDLKHRILRLFYHVTILIYPTLRMALDSREKRFKKYDYNTCKYIINNSGAWGEAKEVMTRDTMGKGIEGEFEGIKAMLPSDYDKYLSTMYGDYMTPPPVEKQISHHYANVVDTEKSYKEYIKG